MKRLLKVILVIGSIVFVGCGSSRNPNSTGGLRPLKPVDFPNQDNSIFGAWEADTAVFGEGGAAQFVTLYFNQRGEFGVLLECMDNGETISASGTRDASIFADRISLENPITLRAEGTKKVESCSMTFDRGDYKVEVRGDQLRLVEPGQTDVDTYSRIR